MRRSVRRGRALAALVIGAETAALFLAYYAFGLRDRIVGLEQSSVVQGSAFSVLATVRAVMPAWLLHSLYAFTSTVGLARVFGSVSHMTASLSPGTGFSAVGGAIVAPAYFAVRRMLRPPPRGNVTSRWAIHWRIRPAKERASALPSASAAP